MADLMMFTLYLLIGSFERRRCTYSPTTAVPSMAVLCPTAVASVDVSSMISVLCCTWFRPVTCSSLFCIALPFSNFNRWPIVSTQNFERLQRKLRDVLARNLTVCGVEFKIIIERLTFLRRMWIR